MAFSLKETGSINRSLLGQAQGSYRTQLIMPIEFSGSEAPLE